MRLRNDDDVHRYQRIFIDFRGWNVGELVKARYVSWGVFVGLGLVLFITIFARTLGGLSGAMWSLAIAGGATWLAAPYLTNEVGPVAWAQSGLAEYRGWRTARNRTRRLNAPVQRWTRTKEDDA